MRKAFWKLAVLALGALQALLRPVTRTVVRLAGRLQIWHDQAEIRWMFEIARTRYVRQCRQRGARPLALSVHRWSYQLGKRK